MMPAKNNHDFNRYVYSTSTKCIDDGEYVKFTKLWLLESPQDWISGPQVYCFYLPKFYGGDNVASPSNQMTVILSSINKQVQQL